MTRYLSLDQILYVHQQVIEAHGGTLGIRDKGLLASSVLRPQASAFGQDAYPSLFGKAAALLHSIVLNHPFLDGNKRAGFGAMHLMLLINHHDLTSNSEEEIKMCLKVATGEMSFQEIENWLKQHSKKKQ